MWKKAISGRSLTLPRRAAKLNVNEKETEQMIRGERLLQPVNDDGEWVVVGEVKGSGRGSEDFENKDLSSPRIIMRSKRD